MAIKLNAGEVTRQDAFGIDPENVLLGRNGRWNADVNYGNPADVATLVHRYETEGGQRTPVEVRRLADNRVELVFGYRRWLAAKEYNKKHPDALMKLKCLVTTCNEEEAFRRNVMENHERKRTTCVDAAHNHRRFREEYGWNDSKIAEFYHCTPAYVCILKNVPLLSNEVQQRMHDGTMSLEAGLSLVGLTNEQQQVALAPIVTEPVVVGTVVQPVVQPVAPTSNEIVNRVRDIKIEQGGKQARSLANVRKFLTSLDMDDEPLQPFAKTFLRFIQGYYTDAKMKNKLEELMPKRKAA